MTSKTAQEYLDAVARVPQMDDDDLGTWYAKAVQQYTSLSLWSRLEPSWVCLVETVISPGEYGYGSTTEVRPGDP